MHLLGCIYTRHYDGFVRQRNIDDLLSVSTPWAPMFVLQPLGEYVIEIAAALRDRITRLGRDALRAFNELNQDFAMVTCERIVS